MGWKNDQVSSWAFSASDQGSVNACDTAPLSQILARAFYDNPVGSFFLLNDARG
jgi:hypothetical protein